MAYGKFYTEEDYACIFNHFKANILVTFLFADNKHKIKIDFNEFDFMNV